MSSLLGVDADSVNVRVQDAMVEAQRELMKRMIEPVRAMAKKLSEQPKEGKDDIVFRDTLVGNVQDIAELVPKLNIAGDPELDKFAAEMAGLTRYAPDTLRKSKSTRAEAAGKAADVVKKLESYAGLL